MNKNIGCNRKELRARVKASRAAMIASKRKEKSERICSELLDRLDRAISLSERKEELVVAVYSAFPEEVSLDSFILGAYEQGINVAFPVMVSDAFGVNGACPQTMEFRCVNKESYVTTRTFLMADGNDTSQGVGDERGGVPFLLHPIRRYHHADNELEPYSFVSALDLLLLVVPCVAFDEQGNRLGYGGGNYDRYLSQLEDSSVAVGVAFREQQLDFVPVEAHDIPLVFVVA